MSDSKSISCTPGLASMLTVLFVGLKLTGHIDWSWWWVLCPLWIVTALFVAVLAFCGVIAGAAVLLEGRS